MEENKETLYFGTNENENRKTKQRAFILDGKGLNDVQVELAYNLQKIIALCLYKPEMTALLKITYEMAKCYKPAWMAEVLDAIISGGVSGVDNSRIMITPEIEEYELELYRKGKTIYTVNAETAKFELQLSQQKIMNDYRAGKSAYIYATYQDGKIDSAQMYDGIRKVESLTSGRKVQKGTAKGAFRKNRKIKATVNFPRCPLLSEHRIRYDDVLVIGADSGKGKTAFAIHLANDLLKSGEFAVQYYNIEVAEDDVYKRFESNYTKMNMDKLDMLDWDVMTMKDHKMTDEGISVLSKIQDRDAEYLEMAESDDLTIVSHVNDIDCILADSLDRFSSTKHNAIVIDHLQIADTLACGKGASLYEKTTYIMKRLSMYATEHKCLVIVLSQLNREGKKNDKATMHDLASSGEIENSASVVMLLNDETEKVLDNPGPGEKLIRVDIGKNRNGDMRAIDYVFNAPCAVWVEAGLAESEDK